MTSVELNQLKLKVAVILAAIKFWMKYKSSISTPNLKINILNNMFYVKLTPRTDMEIEVQLDNEAFKVNYENDVISILPIRMEKVEEIRVKLPRKREIKLKENEVLVRAQTAGKIMKILVHEGEFVEREDLLLIMEAMKMEIELNSPISGVVRKLFVKVGDMVKINDPLLIIERKSR